LTKGYTPHEVQIMAYAASGSRYMICTFIWRHRPLSFEACE